MASLNKLKRGTTPTPPLDTSSMLEEQAKRRAERKERLLNNSQAYVNKETSGFPPLPTAQEAIDFSFDGLNELEEGMTQVSGDSKESVNSTAWQNIARQQSNMASKSMTPVINRNPIINAAATTYNPLGGSCYSQPQQGYGAAMFGMGGGIYGPPLMSQEQAEEIRKAQQSRMEIEKNYLRGTLM